MSPKRLVRVANTRRTAATILPIAVLCALAFGSTANAADTQTGGGIELGVSPITALPASVQPSVTARLLRRHLRAGAKATVRGRVLGVAAPRVDILISSGTGHGWHRAASAAISVGGRFSGHWRTDRPGRFRIAVVVDGRNGGHVSRHLNALYVFRTGHASWYGPGFYGHTTACGGRLTASVVGVANKTLPCGTKVTFRYGNRTVTARVIDRGPYIAGRDWDLTAATKRKLGFPSTGTVLSTR